MVYVFNASFYNDATTLLGVVIAPSLHKAGEYMYSVGILLLRILI